MKPAEDELNDQVAGLFLRWVGGKTQLLPELLARIPAKFDAYYEPFLSGGALFFAMWNTGRMTGAAAHLSDANGELVNAWNAVRSEPGRLCDELARLQRHTSESDFYAMRAVDPDTLDVISRAARFIYLNKTCFNGLYRVNRAGKFNAPWGHREHVHTCDKENILACSAALAGASIDADDYASACHMAKRGDFVYVDPPYVPRSATASFVGYTHGGFGEQQHRELAATFARLAARGVHVLLSNSDTPLVRELYEGKGYRFEIVPARRVINCKGAKRGAVNEVLVSAP
jgi:DNA adenine methylase